MSNEIIRAEFAATMHGVPGRFMNVIGDRSANIVRNQQFITERRPVKGYGAGAEIQATLRFDDECKNGHSSFAITGEITGPARRKSNKSYSREWIAGGCLHEDLAAAFPELAHLIRWHLTSTAGPMHYAANTIWHAGDRDHWGKRKGEPHSFVRHVRFGDNPMTHSLSKGLAKFLADHKPLAGAPAYDFQVIEVAHRDNGKPGTYQFSPKYTFGGLGKEWHECPFDSREEAENMLFALNNCNPQFIDIPTQWGEGKARDFDAARRCAIWPEATDAELMQEPAELRAALEARLPALIEAFRADMDAAGFLWDARR